MDIAQWAWLVWLVLVIVFVVIEVFTLDFTFAMLAGGALLGGLLSSLLGAPPWLQFALAAVLALLLVFLLRPPLLRALHRHADHTPQNVDAIVAQSGQVETPFSNGVGTVKLMNGEVWSARLAGAASLSPAVGARVAVVRVVGATVEVVPLDFEEAESA